MLIYFVNVVVANVAESVEIPEVKVNFAKSRRIVISGMQILTVPARGKLATIVSRIEATREKRTIETLDSFARMH